MFFPPYLTTMPPSSPPRSAAAALTSSSAHLPDIITQGVKGLNIQMTQNFFENLPSEITINILSRLRARNVIRCKCVCKPWLDLTGTREFVKSHLSKSIPVLLINEHLEQSKFYKIVEFEDGLDLARHELHYNPLTKFNLPKHGKIYGSVNGLLFVRDESLKPDGLFICNPFTRDYIKLDCPPQFVSSDEHVVAYGFGVSKISGEYKVVRISQECLKEGVGNFKISIPEGQVYTIGTGTWRSLGPRVPPYMYGGPCSLATRYFGSFLNGNLHWLAYGLSGHPMISCFDLETETFCGFSSPLTRGFLAALCVFDDSLCLCDSESDAEIVIWLMKEHGDEKVWVKVFVISKTPEFFPFRYMIGLHFPLKLFEDGDMLLEWDGCFLFRYSEKDKLKPFDLFCSWHEALIHTPSFLSLKSFDKESVSTF